MTKSKAEMKSQTKNKTEKIKNKIKRKTKPLPNLICPICFDQLLECEVSSTKCGHVFCTECLRKAIKRQRKCPLCRSSLSGAQPYHRLRLRSTCPGYSLWTDLPKYQPVDFEEDSTGSRSDLKQTSIQMCKFCNACFFDSYSLIRHNLTHLCLTLPRSYLYQCDYCMGFFHNKCVLTTHIHLKHFVLHNLI